MIAPNKIKIISDGNTLEFVKTITHDSKGVKMKEPSYQYKYIKSKTKKDEVLTMTETQLLAMLKSEIAK